MQDAGAFSIVLEAVPMDFAGEITSKLEIPTISIGRQRYAAKLINKIILNHRVLVKE